MVRDHGGNLASARAAYGGEDWIDLSTGINRRPWPVPPISPQAWTALPTAPAHQALTLAAARAYGADPARILPLAGAQAAIQLYPRLAPPGLARVLAPTYNEHAASLRAQGWRVEEVTDPEALNGADLAVVVTPNNPDGGTPDPLRIDAGLVVADESFADPHPGLSVAHRAGGRLLVLRSFGKFYGLAGVRLGFLLGDPALLARAADLAGPWSVSGPALEIGAMALGDTAWQVETTARLMADAARLDALALGAGWRLVGGTALFRTYATPDAQAAQDHLARHRIWSRIFPYSAFWVRLGLPDGDDWPRIQAAMKGVPT